MKRILTGLALIATLAMPRSAYSWVDGSFEERSFEGYIVSGCVYKDHLLDVQCDDSLGPTYCFVVHTSDRLGNEVDLQSLNPTEWLLFDLDSDGNKCYDQPNDFLQS
jgi:hypothetical protein